MQNTNANQIPKAEGKNISVRIVSQERQRLSSEMKSKILKAFFIERKQWKNEGQPKENLEGVFQLTVCEKIKMGTKDDIISIPIDHEGEDGGYLHVYGIVEVEE
ncbi:MAG: hypothetical protein KGI11_09640 [Thaumarchaeota archaeon]|nr:hypothetical protein [Nitrososphaerota archaeon]